MLINILTPKNRKHKQLLSSCCSFFELNSAGDIEYGKNKTQQQIENAEFIEGAADVNGDGEIDSVDAVLILKFKAGTITKFPVE